MATKKTPTIAEQYASVEQFLRDNGKDEWADFIATRAEQNAKRSTNRKPSARQTENTEIASAVVGYLRDDPNLVCTISDIIRLVPECAGLQNQRVSSILHRCGSIKREVVKGVAYFSYSEGAPSLLSESND